MRFALFGSYGRGNIGDEAIADGIFKMVTSIDTQAEIGLFSHDTGEAQKIHTQFTSIQPMIATGIRSLMEQWRNGTWKKNVQYLKSCQYIIIGGGGIFHDQEVGQSGFSPLFIWWLRTLFFSFLKKPILIWAVGIGPLTSSISKIWLKGILKRARVITVRDQYSASLILPLVQQKEITVVPDPVWGLFHSIPNERHDNILGINVRENKRLNIQSILEKVIAAIQVVEQQKKINTIWLIPFALREPDDREILTTIQSSIREKFSYPVEIKTEFTPVAVFNLVSQCGHFIAMRFHSYIFASSADIACQLLSYSKKTDEITAYSATEYIEQQKGTKAFWMKQLESI